MMRKLTVLLDVHKPLIRDVFQKCVAEAGMALLESGEDPPDLLVIEVNGNKDALRQRLGALPDRERGGPKVFLVGNDHDTDLLLMAMHAGVEGFFPVSVDEEQVGHSFKAFAAEHQGRLGNDDGKTGKVLSLFSLKGDCGTTTLAVNLAHGAQLLLGGAKVALIDFDLPYGDSRAMLDLECRFDWGEALSNIHRLDSAYLAGLMTVHKSGLRLLPPPSRFDELGAVDADSLAVIMGHLRNVFDVVVVDLGSYMDEVSTRIIEVSDEVLLVSLQSGSCLKRLRRHQEFLRRDESAGPGKYRLVINRYVPELLPMAREQEEALGMPASWMLPNDYRTTLASINLGKPLMECAPKAEITRSIQRMIPSLFTRGDEAARPDSHSLIPNLSPGRTFLRRARA